MRPELAHFFICPWSAMTSLFCVTNSTVPLKLKKPRTWMRAGRRGAHRRVLRRVTTRRLCVMMLHTVAMSIETRKRAAESPRAGKG